MSIADVTAQISDIRSRLALLAQTASVDGGTGFASALERASSATAPTGTAAAAATPEATAVRGAGAVTGDDVVKSAVKYQGVPYVLGGASRSGMDCSGLVQTAFKDVGVTVPRTVSGQETIGQKVGSLKDAKPGDLVVLNGGNHIAIWMGNGQAVHSPYPGRTVSVQKAWFNDSDIVTIRRVVPAAGDSSGTVSAASAATAGAASPASPSGLSPSTLARAAALLGMAGTPGASPSGSDPLASLLPSSGASGSTSTAQQLLAARAALGGG